MGLHCLRGWTQSTVSWAQQERRYRASCSESIPHSLAFAVHRSAVSPALLYISKGLIICSMGLCEGFIFPEGQLGS